MQRVFDHLVKQREVVNQLLSLKQGKRPVSDYTITFRTLAPETGSDQAVLQGKFFF